jgi:hypothetical protein
MSNQSESLNDNMSDDGNIMPLPEAHLYDIEVVQCIHEDSKDRSQSDEVDDEDLEDLIDDDDNASSEVNLHVADENSILEKFLTKRSPRKFNKPLPHEERSKRHNRIENYKDDQSQFIQTEYNVDSMAANLSVDENTEKPIMEEQKHEEADEVLFDEGPRRWIIPTSKVVVCPSGFDADTKDKIKNSVEKLGGVFSLDFTREVTVLITKDNHSDKYKVARKTGAHTVTSAWLKDSIKNDYFINPKDYLFPLFYNCKFHFYDCETKNLVNIVREYRADVVIDIDSSMIGELTIVIPNENITAYIDELRREFSFFSDSFDQNTLKVVTVPWIEAFIEKEYKKIRNYEVNSEDHIVPERIPSSVNTERLIENNKTNAETKILQKFLKKQEQDIEEHIEKLRREPDIQKKFFLMDANISLHNVYEKQDRVEIIRLINV